MYIQKQSALWWTRNFASTIYFLRELTGVFIALYLLYYVALSTNYDRYLAIDTFFRLGPVREIIDWVGLVAALFHTVTWLWVTTKISPLPLKKSAQVGLFILLMILWAGFSYLAIRFLYVHS